VVVFFLQKISNETKTKCLKEQTIMALNMLYTGK